MSVESNFDPVKKPQTSLLSHNLPSSKISGREYELLKIEEPKWKIALKIACYFILNLFNKSYTDLYNESLAIWVQKKKLEIITISFNSFLKELENEIFPEYKNHEQKFDGPRIHGRMHIARAVLYGEVIARYLTAKEHSIDFSYVRRMIALHDVGRRNNGPDLWERDSAFKLFSHLIEKGIPEEEAFKKSVASIKDVPMEENLKSAIFQMFQVMKKDELKLKNPKNLIFFECVNGFSAIKEGFEKEVSEFLTLACEQNIDPSKPAGILNHLLNQIKTNPHKFPLFSSSFGEIQNKKMDEINKTFLEFSQEFETEILSSIENPTVILNKAKNVILAEFLMRYYFLNLNENVDPQEIEEIRRTIAFGIEDINTPESQLNESIFLFFQHLKNKNMPIEQVYSMATFIVTKESNPYASLEAKIYCDSDSLDIMRVLKKGREQFNADQLSFLKDAPPESDDFKFRERLIGEAWDLIQLTEPNKKTADFEENKDFMKHLFAIINQHPEKFKILSTLC